MVSVISEQRESMHNRAVTIVNYANSGADDVVLVKSPRPGLRSKYPSLKKLRRL
jgi:hypothetical protein